MVDKETYYLCPIRSLITDSINKGRIPCIRGKCAWWDKNKEQCAILSLSQKLVCPHLAFKDTVPKGYQSAIGLDTNAET